MSVCLRSRILRTYIKCIPWERWKGEIELFPVSSKTLFGKDGLSIDLLEIDLREEGYYSTEKKYTCFKCGYRWN